ncbi:MAG TPA: AI-2E family transporter, partial [Nitrospinaceae bacterium]|nr:AI-2E family transporter [Nitrospinaceae bacterium]
MNRERNTQIIYFFIIGVLLAVILFYFSRRVLTPFFIAFALAYLLDPVT